jgi:hypothetical protein
MARDRVVEWLLEEDQPSVRYRTLTQVLGRAEDDPEVVAARERIPRVGWAAEILRDRTPGGWWGDNSSLYRPKYLATNWKLLVLADLGVTRAVPGVAESCELWMDRFATKDGGFGLNATASGHLCLAGNTARALIQFGYADEPRVRTALEWLARAADPKGGWSCFGSGRNLDSWEGLSAFAVYPRRNWTPEMRTAVERGAEFFLERELHRQGGPYAPWFRFHYPVHYYYDLLVGLDVLTSLGYGADPRLSFALARLQEKRGADGRWSLDALHPDVEGGVAEWFRTHPKHRPTPWGLEEPGRPSKMITLRALTVLERIRATTQARPARTRPPRPTASASVLPELGRRARPVRSKRGSRGRAGARRAPGRSR